MGTYGVRYGAPKRTLASLYSGNASMQPMSSAKPVGISTAASQQPVSDVLNSAQVANQGRFSTINSALPGNAAYGMLNPGTTTPTAPAAPSPASSAAPSNTSPAGSTATAPASFDETADPILAQIKAAGLRNVQGAFSGALANAKTDLVNYGSVNVPQSLKDLYANATPTSDALLGDLPGNSVLGALNDQGTAKAASANPFSTLAQLLSAHNTNTAGIDNTSNLSNLYYSSTHGNQLAQEGQDYLSAQNTAASNLAQLLGGENQNVLNAIGSAHDSYMQQLPAEYANWITMGGPTTTGGTTGGGTTTPGDGTTTDTSGGNSGGALPTGVRTPNLYDLLGKTRIAGPSRPLLAY